MLQTMGPNAVLTLPLGPRALRVAALVLLWVLLVVFLVLMLAARPDTVPGLWWGLFALFAVGVVLQSAAEWHAMKERKKLAQAAQEVRWIHGQGGDARIRSLLVEREKVRARLRHAMGDIVDTVREKVFDTLHNCSLLSAGEANVKAFLWDKAADTFHENSESKLNWGRDWPPVGGHMRDQRTGKMVEVRFGSTMRRLYFHLESGFLNGASYGATPRPVLEGQIQWDAVVQRNPVAWRFKALPLRLRQAEVRLANLLGCDPDDLKLVCNANAATSSILKSLPW
eukprot:Sspe_Gene.14769::Locus_5122_Transcript_2_2_Confidence_0.400_Length_1536::g.14769::m.14769